MDRRHFISALGAIIAAPSIVRAAAPERSFKFGVLTDMNGIFHGETHTGDVSDVEEDAAWRRSDPSTAGHLRRLPRLN